MEQARVGIRAYRSGFFLIAAFLLVALILPVCAVLWQSFLGKNGEIIPYTAMNLSLSYDHRALDGAPASRFLKELKDYLEIKPENVDRIKALVKSKKLFVGPYYCSTDSLLVDSESIIKNLQLGIKDSEEYGCKDFIA